VNAVRRAAGIQTALMWAVTGGRHEIVRLLIASGANIHIRSKVRTEYVSFGLGDIRKAARISGKADGTLNSDGTRPGRGWIKKGGLTAFLFAAQRDDLESATTLVAAGADINETTPEGSSALMIAIQNDADDVAAFLLVLLAAPTRTSRWIHRADLAVARRADGHRAGAPEARRESQRAADDRVAPIIEGASSQAQIPDSNLLGATPFLLAAAQERRGFDARISCGTGANPPHADGRTAPAPLIGVEGYRPRRSAVSVRSVRLATTARTARAVTRGGGAEAEAEILAAAKLAVELGNDVNAARQRTSPSITVRIARTLIGRDEGDTALHTAIADRLPMVSSSLSLTALGWTSSTVTD